MTILAPPPERDQHPSGTRSGQAGSRRPARRRSLAGYLSVPVLCAVLLAAVYLYTSTRTWDEVERQQLPIGILLTRTWQHIELTAVSTAVVLAVAIPLGILLTRRLFRPVMTPTVATFSVGQAIPSIGILALLAIAWAIGFWPVIVALAIYTVIPVLRNTMVGLQQVDPSVIESARGMGMTKARVLARIELPLAVPIIMAGLRTALTLNVGTATLATFIGGGGLGSGIVAGIGRDRPMITLTYAAVVAVLALMIDYVASIAEDVLRPHGV